MTRRIAFIVEYEGTGYAGFQRQANARSIQEELENAIESLTKARPTVRGAGRTDAGTHAIGQVAAFDTESAIPLERIAPGLNYYLGEQIAARSAHEVASAFDPRRDALARVYRYRILESRQPSPLRRRFTHRIGRALDASAMNAAAQSLVGERDFRAFSGAQPPGKSYVRRMARAEAWREGDELAAEFEANAFLPQQARRMVAALAKIGLGESTREEFEQMLESGAQGEAEVVFPARGLTLREVRYAGFPPENDGTTTNHKTRATVRP